jgi:hypothetical protein
MKKNLLFVLGLILFLFLFHTSLTFAQTEEEQLSLRLSRDFGYSSGTGDIQGTFSMRVSGPDDLVRVVFFIDEQPLGDSTVPPFRLRFSTDDFPTGIHRLAAVGYSSSGKEYRSNEIQAEFVTAQQGWQQALKFILPLLGFIALAVIISLLFPMLISRGKTTSLQPGAARSYRPFGGTICPKCQRPFGMHLYGINLLVGKYDRCPHCGKWSLVRSASSAQLAAAEAAEIEAASHASQARPVNEAEQFERDLTDSRYQDL